MLSVLRCLLFVQCLSVTLAVDWDVLTDLDQYVQSDDGHYDWWELASYRYNGVTLYILNMTSQLYQSEEFSTRPIWWHIMGVAIPDRLDHLDFATLAISGGSNDITEPPGPADAVGLLAVEVANSTRIITGYVSHVPNQPVRFYNDPTFISRIEDQIIAWSWRTFADAPEPKDPTVILRMPMTKAVKRGMDTVTALAKIRVPGSDIQKFAITGISKRGWTAWSIACTDKRVVAAVPMVFSLINLPGDQGTLMNHYRNMGEAWSFALGPYWNENLTQELVNPDIDRLWHVEDMYYFKERFTLPFLAISSTGDEFFLTDDNHNWWHDFPDPKWLMMLPNAEHVMAGHYDQIFANTVSFIYSVANNIPLPKVSWTRGTSATGGPSVRYVADPPPLTVNAYYAATLPNDVRRDYRLLSKEPGDRFASVHPVVWRHNITVQDLGGGEYYAEVDPVDGEWTALFIEGEWEGPTGARMAFTSQVSITPDTRPGQPCHDALSCYAYLT